MKWNRPNWAPVTKSTTISKRERVDTSSKLILRKQKRKCAWRAERWGSGSISHMIFCSELWGEVGHVISR